MALALVRLAMLGRAHGLRGEVKAELTADDDSLLRKAESLWLEKPGEAPSRVRVERVSGSAAALRVKLQGVDTCEAAQALRGCSLSVDAKDLPEPEEGTYWVHQIVGYQVSDARRGVLGSLKSVVPTGANDCFEVQPAGGESYLVPVTDLTLKGVDHAAGVISMDLLDGSVPGEVEDDED